MQGMAMDTTVDLIFEFIVKNRDAHKGRVISGAFEGQVVSFEARVGNINNFLFPVSTRFLHAVCFAFVFGQIAVHTYHTRCSSG